MNLLISFITFVSLYTPIVTYNIVPAQTVPKKKIVFFPASLQKPIPKEMYHGFVDALKNKYDVEVHSSQNEYNYKDDKEIFLLSHSSGAMQMMDAFYSIPENITKKAVLIDPLDFQKYSRSIQVPQMPNIDLNALDDKLKEVFEKDYIGDFLSSFKDDSHKNETLSKILVMNHANTNEWRYIPFMPPLSILKMEFDNMVNATITEKTIEKYNHFDILDKPWATQINKMSFQKQETNPEEYHNEIIPQINEFYNN